MAQWWKKYVGRVKNAGLFFPEESWIELRSVRGHKLMTYRFEHPDPKALVFMFHGMYVDSNEGSHVAKMFFDAGFTVLAMDQESHGKSQGEMGRICSFNDYATDSEKYIVEAKYTYPKLPIFIAGLSMGGSICTMIALSRPDLIQGMILFAPSLAVANNLEPFLQKIVRCLNLCCSCLKLKNLDLNKAIKSKTYIQYYNEHPGIYKGKISVKSAVSLLNDLKALQRMHLRVDVPVLLIQGDADKVINVSENQYFIDHCKSVDKQIVIYEGVYHDIYHDKRIEEIVHKCIEWVEARIFVY